MSTSEQSSNILKNQYTHSALTGEIVRCAMTVHSKLGTGFEEVIYQRALVIEFIDAGIAFKREFEMPSPTTGNA
jgi:GxxExxY protein